MGWHAHLLDFLLLSVKSSRFAHLWQSQCGECLERKDILSQIQFLDFGNQRIHDYIIPGWPFYDALGFIPPTPDNVPVKLFFSHIGITNYTSLDWNGEDGSLKVDAREDLRSILPGRYDVIANSGFAEHVGEFDTPQNLWHNQYIIWRNFHNLGEVGSVYFHNLPHYRTHWLHGVCGYDIEFARELIRINNYQTIMLFDHPYCCNAIGRKEQDEMREQLTCTIASYVKMNSDPFMSYEEFTTLPGLQSRYHDMNFLHVTVSYKGKSMIVKSRELLVEKDLEDESSHLCQTYLIPDTWSNLTDCTDYVRGYLQDVFEKQQGNSVWIHSDNNTSLAAEREVNLLG